MNTHKRTHKGTPESQRINPQAIDEDMVPWDETSSELEPDSSYDIETGTGA